MPNPPLRQLPPIVKRRKNPMTGVHQYLSQFETSEPPKRKIEMTPAMHKEKRFLDRTNEHQKALEPAVDEYRKAQRECEGTYRGMNCYNTLFVGRLAYEVSERKLLREFESFGPVKDIKIITDKDGKSRGYAFIEYEYEDDMKRAFRAADGMRIEGRPIVVDVERGHTVPTFLPRRLGGGLGGTRIGGKNENQKTPGRYNPSRPPEPTQAPPLHQDVPQQLPPPPQQAPSGYRGGAGGGGANAPSYRGGPPTNSYYGGGGEYDRGGDRDYDSGRRRRRSRSRSPEPRGRYEPKRSRYGY